MVSIGSDIREFLIKYEDEHKKGATIEEIYAAFSQDEKRTIDDAIDPMKTIKLIIVEGNRLRYKRQT
jgi:hypothetical protein